ncbi:MAG: glycine cleavage system protein R [Puniceicoccaceae bacterium]|nr:MAG: glycine cleavage system protein R [Puniceicoccaceae bacterium]
MKPLLFTLVAEDRPGLVDTVAAVVNEHGGNWLESRMCRLGRQFAGIIRVEVPVVREENLTNALNALAARGMAVTIHPAGPPGPQPAARRIRLEVVGQDRPGIVRQIAHALAEFHVNVEDMKTSVGSAPMSGEPLFRARAEALVPEGVAIESIRRGLEQIAADLMVDLTLEEDAG